MTTKKILYSIEEIEKEFGALTFSGLLSSHRLCEEISQKEFAKFLGISLSSLCDLEKGRTIPSVSRARKIAKKLKMNEEVFIELALQELLNREGLKKLKVSLS